MIALALALALLSGSVPTNSHDTITGLASWYPAAAGTAAAGPAVRVMLDHRYMGKRLRVCLYGTARCITTTIRDVCLCRPPFVSSRRAIDLSDDDFARLVPLSRGVVKVTIEALP